MSGVRCLSSRVVIPNFSNLGLQNFSLHLSIILVYLSCTFSKVNIGHFHGYSRYILKNKLNFISSVFRFYLFWNFTNLSVTVQQQSRYFLKFSPSYLLYFWRGKFSKHGYSRYAKKTWKLFASIQSNSFLKLEYQL